MHKITKNRSVVSKAAHAADQATAPLSAVLSRRELRRIVAEMLG